MLKLDEEKKKFIVAIGNPSRLKILLALWKSDKELTVYKICQRTGLGRSAVARHLSNLAKIGLVSRKVFGEIPLYTINKSDFRTQAMIEFFAKAKL